MNANRALDLCPALRACALSLLPLVGLALSGCEPEGPAVDDASGRDGAIATLDASAASDAASATDGGGAAPDAGAPTSTLAARYPGDRGMGSDPAVVWFEDFEEGSIAAIGARYDQVRDDGGFELVRDTPSGIGTALALRASPRRQAVDLYKQLPDHDAWYVRWYAKYDRDVTWHHSGMWFGGYNPASPWPSPGAGSRPRGDDRFSVAVEPVWRAPTLRFDFYDYWMSMHSWMESPVDDGTAYYGNALVHRNDFTVDEGSWVCLEAHVRLNPDPRSGEGAMLEVWKNDALVASFTDEGPRGYWIRDKFCPEGADGSECTDYPAAFDERLDLRFRSVEALRLNAFWPQNYITEGPEGTLIFDQMVVATTRVGCMR